jgi:hypothetical protein
MRIGGVGRAGLWVLVLSAAIGTIAWLADGATAMPLRNSPPLSEGEQLGEVMRIVLALAAMLVIAGAPSPFGRGSARIGWALLAIGTASIVVGSEAPFVTGVYSLAWPFWAWLGGHALAVIGMVLVTISVRRTAGPPSIPGALIAGAAATEVLVGGLAAVGLVVLALGVAWLERLGRLPTAVAIVERPSTLP